MLKHFKDDISALSGQQYVGYFREIIVKGGVHHAAANGDRAPDVFLLHVRGSSHCVAPRGDNLLKM
ncbi:hypothetical protein [Salidesulfovibrio brasiliensis]|uniref:hypothetical protein n=1 Tax=Salidesulfovibrio brasiliensis TaxID=221711 RepID=UPI000AD58879|nr:hypothetical protein [Salidesulfovibrio brasiliensis]